MRWIALALLAYWAVFALVAPVTVWDAQVYNLARLPIIERGGLFGNSLWTSPRQEIFPLSFDAIHLPFIKIGGGYDVPSYLCLVGALVVGCKWIDRRRPGKAWWFVGLILAMPTLVFQAVSCKNDLALLFFFVAGLYFLDVWRRQGGRAYLVLAAMAACFLVGTKGTGIALGFGLGLAGICLAWRRRAGALLFLSSLPIGLLFLGSAETYLNNRLHYGHFLGPPGLASDLINRDGLRGALANGIRYAFGAVDLGWPAPPGSAPSLAGACRHVLRTLGLAGAGYRPDFSDANLVFLRQHGEASSAFGLVGLLLPLVAGAQCFVARRGSLEWAAAWAGFAVLALVAGSVAWMPWNMRFLLLPFFLFALSAAAAAGTRLGSSRWLGWAGLLLIAQGAVLCPLYSFNRAPRDLFDSIARREEETFKERPSMLAVYRTAVAWQRSHRDSSLYLLAGGDSWVLPFLGSRDLAVRLATEGSLPGEGKEASQRPREAGILVLDRPDFLPWNPGWRLVRAFPSEPGTAFYEFIPGRRSGSQPNLLRGENFFSDGWTGCDFTLLVRSCPEGRFAALLSNPTPMVRTVIFRSSGRSLRRALAPGETAVVSVPASSRTVVRVSVTPAYLPSRVGGSADTRRLGIRLALPGGFGDPAP